ncbi:DUF3613 domain-containing protein [Algiphilus sp. W345]|uniref:DUF3613 domain-containing protein n=1 Tax=Banduia mediterranea TaxID=3075609 RepID=A0ABU2WGW6_9GAMM|nr:DUF3613 domain-containing protein [Algiphilus sp. W345]MDT0496768.1 DUF3613 domain-containing protein [Algiphilus sp. W345]
MRYLISIVLFCVSTLTVAETPAIGVETKAWLDLQTSNDAAIGAPEPLAGEVASRVYQRYLDSFEYPIPETFDRERFVEDGGGSN